MMASSSTSQPRALSLLLFGFAACVCAHEMRIPLEDIQPHKIVIGDSNGVVVVSNTTMLSKSGQNVNISWSGVSAPSKGDWLGLYELRDNVTLTAPAKFQYASVSPTHLRTGSGSMIFRILNSRSPLIVHFFTGGVDAPVVVGSSAAIEFSNYAEPLQGRIHLTEDPSVIKVSWTSNQTGDSPQVQWGFASGSYSQHSLVSLSYTYQKSDMCGAPATTIGYRDPGMFHSADIDGLKSGQTVFYRFGDPTTGMSQEFSFTAPPAPTDSVHIVAYGDLGQYAIDHSLQQEQMIASRNTTDAIEALEDDAHLVVHIGDISYARGYTSQWEQFHDQIQPIATARPYITCIGNHERDYPGSGCKFNGTDSGGECGVAYETRFQMPRPAADKPWYSVNFGPIHFLIMSTEHHFVPGSEQYQFFVNDIKSINRTVTPWFVFGGHRPFYIDSTNKSPVDGDQTVAAQMRDAFEDLLVLEGKVDLIWGAHHHSYQSSNCRVYKGKCDKRGAWIQDIGMSGAGNSQNLQIIKPPFWKVVDDTHHGYVRVFANATNMDIEYVRGDDRQVHDTLSIAKP